MQLAIDPMCLFIMLIVVCLLIWYSNTLHGMQSFKISLYVISLSIWGYELIVRDKIITNIKCKIF
jgi:fumarate reductase subunit D